MDKFLALQGKFWNILESKWYFKAILFAGAVWKTLQAVQFGYQSLTRVIGSPSYLRILQRRYGPNTWAVITGGSMGIGKGFAKSLARAGFNICIISNDEQENSNTIAELQKINQNIQTMAIFTDFTKCQEEKFFENLFNQIKDLNISILINNAGVIKAANFEDLQENDIKNMLLVNTFPIVFLCKYIYPILKQRPRAAIINLSSITSDFIFPLCSIYGATKSFINNFTLSLQTELNQDNIDILCVKPFAVSTRMLGFMKGKLVVEPEECANSALEELVSGKYTTHGHWKHELYYNIQFKLSNLFGQQKFQQLLKHLSKPKKKQQ